MMLNYKYVVARVDGGIMEQPERTYHNHQEIVATCKKQAREIYDSKYSCYYFTGSVTDDIGYVNEPITDPTPISESKEADKKEWLGERYKKYTLKEDKNDNL